MATASTAVLTALVALALGNLQMIDAAIDQCTTANTGSTEIFGFGTWKKDLGVVKLPKYLRKFKILIPSMGVCPNPVGVKMRVCDFPIGGAGWERPKVSYASFDVAFLNLSHNNDPDTDDFLKVLVYCTGTPYLNNEGDDAKVIVLPLLG